MRTAWIDASAGVAGDMLLAALLDAGAAPPPVRAAVDAVVPGEVRLVREEVARAGMRAARVRVVPGEDGHPHRTWRDVRRLLVRAGLPDRVREDALAVFGRLAAAEARVHGVAAGDVVFHEAGAWDSIADVVGVCAALDDLAATDVAAGPVAVGAGRVATAHGDLPVPVPAVAELAAGRRVVAGGDGELATPTGMALLAVLAREAPGPPPMRLEATGVGAGSRDTPGRPNVVRVLLGAAEEGPAGPGEGTAEEVVLEANVDDLDPRVWPGVLASLLEAGASDAWLVPVLMKKGRPAHTLCVLGPPGRAAVLRTAVFRLTSTLGVRERTVRKTALRRGWARVDVLGARLPIKVGHRDGRIVQAAPEFEDAARLAADRGVPVRAVLDAAVAAAHAAGLAHGEPAPPGLAAGPSA
ncbi:MULTISPECIES: nickel pincer cofactor biosynthesis protein LarC [Actinomadura]|uniref:nickel pincer cofactor biosynthesis protein LarC n=1 Tax=Actinomadura TaxID=1988 RepID=UPI000419E6EF|nr:MULTISPECIES: nickel pincer cofactor biosynthesis protein LarC [Actinomadura]RSN72027.1 nickel pincer cofactor biosynthesis protein LarC [Actinomadura sp. WAC 06369]